MMAARPINDVIDDPACDAGLKKQLEEVRAIRDFASHELGLPDNDSYRSYADLQRPFVAWNVFAAPEFSLRPESWCMPIVGCVGYRGFFNESDAEALAKELREQGFDTFVGGIPAYSTLGYFSDPVLNTFLRRGSVDVARLIFHELAHQVVFAEGDTVFNESYATVVEEEGLKRWLAHKQKPELAKALAAPRQHKASFVDLVKVYRGRLEDLYASELSPERKRAAKAEIFAELKTSYLKSLEAEGAPPVYQKWLEQDLNNAKIASLGLYTQLYPAFEAILKEEGNDLTRFYARVALLASLPYAERTAALKQAVQRSLQTASN
jgi:predicted aminopeptidase